MTLTFTEAANKVKTLKTSPTNDEKLQLYGLYKQSTVGDCNISKPSFYQLEAVAKWNAWEANKGKTTEKSETEYVTLVESLVTKYGTK